MVGGLSGYRLQSSRVNAASAENLGLTDKNDRDMARAVIVQERICTTRAKAKEARKLIEKLITLGKKDTLASRRRGVGPL